jgi:hypothetical protein
MSQHRPRRASNSISICLAEKVRLAMIRDTRNSSTQEVAMCPDNMLMFGETTHTMTYEEGLAFIERTRRQLDRFDVALPHDSGQTIAPKDATNIRRQLDALEAEFKRDLGIA